MADLPPYQRTFSFAGYQANKPADPVPGLQIDRELDDIAERLKLAGKSAYDLAVLDGFTGSRGEWLLSLVGPPGQPGQPGGPGAPGVVQSVNGKSAAAITLVPSDLGALAVNGDGSSLKNIGDAAIAAPSAPDQGIKASKIAYIMGTATAPPTAVSDVLKLRRYAALYGSAGVKSANTAAQNKAGLDLALADAAANGFVLVLPDGDISCAPLAVVPGNDTFGLKLVGSPRTRLIFNGDGDCIVFGDGNTPVLGVQLEQFEVWSSTQRTTGAAIRFRKASRCVIDRVQCGTPQSWGRAGGGTAGRMLYHGFWFDGVTSSELRTCMGIGCQGRALSLGGPADQSFGAEFRVVGHCEFQQCGLAVELRGGIGGVYLSSGAILFCDAGIDVNAGAGASSRELFIDPAFTTDTCTGVGIHFAPGSLSFLLATSLWSCGHGSDGVRIDPGQVSGARFKFVQPRLRSNGGQGLFHLGAAIWMVGGDLSANANSGLVTGNPSGDASLFWRSGLAEANASYAVNVLSTATNYLIDGLDKIANGSGGVLGHTASSTKTIRNGTTNFVVDA